MVRLMATSSKRAYAMPKSAAPGAPAPVTVHCWPTPPQEMLKHSSVSVSVGSLGPGVHKVFLRPLCVFGGNGVLLGFLWPWMWLSFRWDGSHWGLEQESDLFWFLSIFFFFFKNNLPDHSAEILLYYSSGEGGSRKNTWEAVIIILIRELVVSWSRVISRKRVRNNWMWM